MSRELIECHHCHARFEFPALIAHVRKAHPKSAPHFIGGVIDMVDMDDLPDGAYWATLESYGIDVDDARRHAKRHGRK